MTRYDMRLCTDKGVRIHDKVVRDKGAKYDPAGISGKLACRRDGLPQGCSLTWAP